MTDLETAIRDALQSRADAIDPYETILRSRRPRRWIAPLLAAALVVALVAVTLVLVARKDASKTPAAGTNRSSFVGYSWRLVQINDRQGRLTLPATTKADVSFARGGLMTGNDTVHALQVRYRVVSIGYEPVGQVTTSDDGLAGGISATLKRTLFAIGSCFSPPPSSASGTKPPPTAPIPATVHGDRLTVHVGGIVLTFVRNGTVVRIHG
jgi:hypothetical protein